MLAELCIDVEMRLHNAKSALADCRGSDCATLLAEIQNEIVDRLGGENFGKEDQQPASPAPS